MNTIELLRNNQMPFFDYKYFEWATKWCGLQSSLTTNTTVTNQLYLLNKFNNHLNLPKIIIDSYNDNGEVIQTIIDLSNLI